MSGMNETKILKEDWEIGGRLKSLSLDKDKLLSIRTMALGGAADATPYHALTAEGTFSYHIGTFALRSEFVGDIWKIDRSGGIESICNDKDRIKVIFSNVDVACSDAKQPKPRSSKGAGAERLCSDNDLFGGLPHFATKQNVSDDPWIILYLMVAPDGAAELSQPIVKDNTFKEFIERIYLSDGSDFDSEPEISLDDDEVTENFDPQIVRKK